MLTAAVTICLVAAPGLVSQSTVGPATPGTADSTAAQQHRNDPTNGPYFYHGFEYGHEAYMGPLDVMLNKGFALAQAGNKSRSVFDYSYGVDGVTDALAHPVAAIERGGGWWRFIRTEILPLTPNPSDAKWYTNYTGHLIEGGIHWRRLKEWFEAKHVPLAGLLSGITTSAASVLNELYETGGSTTGSAATVADLYVFDLAGILFLSSDRVARFFSETLNAEIWPGQASFTFPEAQLHNNGSRLVVKVPVELLRGTSLFYWTGIGAQGGLSFHRGDGLDVTLAVGTDATKMGIDPVTGEENVQLRPSAGLFLDRGGSLLWHANLSLQNDDRLFTLNVYPGVIPILGGSLGGWFSVDPELKVRFGITSRHSLGVGAGFGW